MTDGQQRLASTGIPGLDEILHGGLRRGRTYLLHGGPGTGKTTTALEFLREGDREGERTLYVSLLQSTAEMDDILASHEWQVGGMRLVEIPEEVRSAATKGQTFFSPADVELTEVSDAVLRLIEEHGPERFVLDSVSELGTLVETQHQLRRQLLRIKDAATALGCTTILTATEAHLRELPAVHTIVHGVIKLDIEAPTYGTPKRKLEVTKIRGADFAQGMHDFDVRTGGLDVFPRLRIPAGARAGRFSRIASGNEGIDSLFGGGLESGTSCLLGGTTGAGKTTLASLYVEAAAERGDRSTVFCFDERRENFLRRAEGLGMPMSRHVEEGLVAIHDIPVGETSPGRLAHGLQRAVEEEGAKLVVLDSITGYFHAFPGERELNAQLHEIISYLTGKDVLTFLISAFHDIGDNSIQRVHASYMADTVVLMRNFGAGGMLRHSISVLKKRHGVHERTVRELSFGEDGVKVGPPLREFANAISGWPEYRGEPSRVFGSEEERADGSGA